MDVKTLTSLHRQFFPFLWTVMADLLVILATYSSSKVAMVAHGLLGISMVLFSIIVATPMLLNAFPHLDPQKNFPSFFHILFGCICLCLMLWQGILGILTRVNNFMGSKSQTILNFKRMHMVTGIALLVITKMQVYYKLVKMNENSKIIILMVLEIILLYIYIKRKAYPTNLTYSDLREEAVSLKPVRSLKPLITSKNKLVVYGNNVYDISSMTEWHPAGFQLLQDARNGEVEKYLFGVYSSNKLLSIKNHPHTSNAPNLLENPIAKLDIPSCYQGLGRINAVTVDQLKLVSQGAQVYELHLKTNGPLQFNGYTDIKQLGRFYCFTMNKNITRLYTCANFLNWENAILLKPHLKNSKSLEKYYIDRICHRQAVPLLFKHYSNGQFTHQFVTAKRQDLNISQEQGLGLQLDEIPSGEVVLMAGGTGIFPFSDLIDLIYKKHLTTNNPGLTKHFIQKNPLLNNEAFNKFTFRLYAAFQTLQEMHPITLQQLTQLSNSKIISILLNVKSQPDRENYPQFKFTQQRFEKLAIKLKDQEKSISKVFICGPPRMNQALESAMSQHFGQEKYTIL